ncbi:E3 SUMO-protein ligase NSE2 [Polyrhizophydium stewartii]|uniref:E3 SUMO-protein ligase NSE2 n=1 Tax=Polyrhizophydium stewartii TaxID=2732419 RepID=A0ABR4MXB2_9FUNG|nr:hypothetical protein HK105_001131 [Polyrhizophydium stewartii]
MAHIFATKFGTLQREHELVLSNAETVLSEIEVAATELERALAEADGRAEHTNPAVCSSDSGVVELDEHFRKMCEARRVIENQVTVLEQLRQRQQQAEPIEGMSEWFAQELKKLGAKLPAIAVDNYDKYLEFRTALWEVRNPNRRFPVAAAARGLQHTDDNEDDNEDIVVTNQTVNYKCPITLQIMRKVFTSRTCKHSFSEAILQSFGHELEIDCPIPGCTQRLRASDLQPDRRMERKIELWLREKRAAGGSDDDEDGDADSVV